MGTIDDPGAPKSAGPAELFGVLLFLSALAAVQLALAGAYSLFSRHFWLDEMYTQRLVADAELTHMLAALRGGVETHPPTYYLLLRGLTALVGTTEESALRAASLLAVLLGLVGVYAAVRRAYAPLVALTATVALWSHPLVQRYAFEARMYGPWMAAAAWFIYALTVSRQPGRGPLCLVLLAGTSVLLCILHYFGILVLALVLAVHLWWARSFRWSVLLAAAAGPAALLACTPFLLGQRAAITVPTWVKSPDLMDVAHVLLSVLLPRNLALVPVAAGAWWLLRGRHGPKVARGDLTGIVTLAGLALLPVALAVFSVTVQPVLVDRYALPATAAVAAVTALVLVPLSRPWLVALCVLLAAGATLNLRELAREYAERDLRTDALIAAIRTDTGDEIVVFEQPHELHPVCRYAPDLANRCFLLDFENTSVASRSRIFNRDLARRFAEFYGSPGLVSVEHISSLRRYYLVRESGHVPIEMR